MPDEKDRSMLASKLLTVSWLFCEESFFKVKRNIEALKGLSSEMKGVPCHAYFERSL